MGWEKVSKLIGKYAPVVGTLVGGPAGSAVGALVATALGVENSPEAVEKEISKNPSKAQEALKQLQERNKHQYEMMLLEMQKTAISEQARTARAEIKSESKYVMWWRPTFGYMLALSFFVWTSAFSYMLIKLIDNPAGMSETVSSVAQLMGSLSIIWGTALAVLGINVSSRSKDKQIEKTGEYKGLISQILGKK